MLTECLTSRRGPRTAGVAAHTPEAVSAMHLNLGEGEDSAPGSESPGQVRGVGGEAGTHPTLKSSGHRASREVVQSPVQGRWWAVWTVGLLCLSTLPWKPCPALLPPLPLQDTAHS